MRWSLPPLPPPPIDPTTDGVVELATALYDIMDVAANGGINDDQYEDGTIVDELLTCVTPSEKQCFESVAANMINKTRTEEEFAKRFDKFMATTHPPYDGARTFGVDTHTDVAAAWGRMVVPHRRRPSLAYNQAHGAKQS